MKSWILDSQLLICTKLIYLIVGCDVHVGPLQRRLRRVHHELGVRAGVDDDAMNPEIKVLASLDLAHQLFRQLQLRGRSWNLSFLENVGSNPGSEWFLDVDMQDIQLTNRKDKLNSNGPG